MFHPYSRLLQRFVEEPERKSMADDVVDLAVQLTGAERGLFAVRQDSGELLVESARNVDRESLKGRSARLSMTVVERVFQAQTTVFVSDALEEGLHSPSDSAVELGIRSVVCVPVWLHGQVRGTLYVDTRFIPGAFTDKDTATLEFLSEFLRLHLWRREVDAEARALRDEAERIRTNGLDLENRIQEYQRILNSAGSNKPTEQSTDKDSPTYPGIVGTAPALRKVFEVMERVARTDVTVLITGESGTGKELVADALHRTGRRCEKPFVAINCSSIPATLIESELFGHVRGAFTGAQRDKKGLFEVADTGTLFLDEVGDMPLEMQSKLLRALQYGEIQPLGSVATRKVDVRVIAATNRNLEEMVAKGQFREDLYYRLNIVSIVIPPLRRRIEDIPLLVSHFLAANRKAGLGEVEGITPRALLLLSRHTWPGNVRELEMVIKSACLFASGRLLDEDDFDNLRRTPGAPGAASTSTHDSMNGTLEEIERRVILERLETNKGNKKKTARELGIDRRTLYNKLAEYGYKLDSGDQN